MALQNSSISKKLFWIFAILLWSGGLFWAGWQSPTLIGGPFVNQQEQPDVARFYPLDRFVISVPGDNTPHYLLLELALKSRSQNVSATLQAADPVVRNSLMKMFSRKHFDQLNDANQLEGLQNEALLLLSEVMIENQFPLEIDEVLFTRMVIQ
ncbi:flagellar basal body-associated protein FliL [Shewanella waksmanii]|uniref:flagellar basal body-associated FliL family protein n=1 Tax=Shewanella waksmanii TaxID=213783 RepID=UPI0037368F9F